MVWKPTSPDVRQVPGPPVSQAIDEYHVRSFAIDLESGSVALRLTLAEGFTEEGAFVEVARREVHCVDEAVLGPILEALSDSTKSRRNTVRDGLYEVLEELGEIPAGSAE